MDGISSIGPEFYGNGSLTKPFQSLVNLRISDMLGLKEWVIPRDVKLSGLRELRMIKCPKLIGELPSQLPFLKKLVISECPELVLSDGRISILQSSQVDLPDGHLFSLQILKIANMPTLQLPEEILRMGLKRLTIKCSSIEPLPNDSMMHIEELVLEECPSFEYLLVASPSMTVNELYINNCEKFKFHTVSGRSNSCYNSLERLKVGNAGDSFNEISLRSFPKLRTLHIQRSDGLSLLSVPLRGQNLASLHSLKISSCRNLLSFPQGGLPAPNLNSLSISRCKKLKSLPEDMSRHLPSLRVLSVYGCPEIESFPD